MSGEEIDPTLAEAGIHKPALHPVQERRQAQSEQTDQQEAHIGCGANETRQQGPRFLRPDLHDQGHAQRPFAAHAERRKEAQHHNLLGTSCDAT